MHNERNKIRNNCILDASNVTFHFIRASIESTFSMVFQFFIIFCLRFFFSSWSDGIKKVAKIALLLSISFNVYGLEIGRYIQEEKGSSKGHVIISKIFGDEIYAEIFVSGEPLNFSIEQIGKNEVALLVTSNKRVKNDEYVTIAVETPSTNKSRIFAANSSIGNYEEPQFPLAELPQEPDQRNGQTLEVLIDGGKRILTVRDTIDSLNLYTGYKLIEMPGDASALNILLNRNIKIEKYEDIYAASNGKIKNIYIDDENGLIRITDKVRNRNKQPIALNETTTQKTTMENLIKNYNKKTGYTLIEMPGDSVNLLTSVNNTPLQSYNDLYHLTQKKITHVFVDNINKTVRLTNKKNILKKSEAGKIPQYKSLSELLNQYAKDNSLKLIEMPGDQALLSKKIRLDKLIRLNDLYKYEKNIKIDVDNKLQIIRIRSI